jgi:hypothetical protein
MKKIGVLGSRGVINNAAFLSTGDFLSSFGMNSGNLLFQYAVCKSIKDDVLIVGEDIAWDSSLIREKCRALIVPSANFIREDFDLTDYVKFLESCGLPVLFVGLGVQADSYDHLDLNLHPSIHRLMALIAEQNIGVGVRGEFTANFLNKHGVNNVSVIGCPSNFINTDMKLHEKLMKKWQSDVFCITTTGDEPWPKNKEKQIAERKLFSMAYEMRGIYVQQSVAPFVEVLRMNNPYSNVDIRPELPKLLQEAIAPDIALSDFRRFFSSSTRLYISIEQWLEEMSRFDFSIGLRLHGNMVPHQVACPSVWVTHDARTKELTETMALPNLSVEEFNKMSGYLDVKKYVDPNYHEYGVRRSLLRDRYIELLNNIYVATNF